MSKSAASGAATGTTTANSQRTLKAKNLVGIVTNVDQTKATIHTTHSKYGNLETKPTQISLLRKSTGFGTLVKNVCDFLFDSDWVVINIKQTKKKAWTVSEVQLLPSQRPVHYQIRDYFRNKLPAHWPQPTHCHIPAGRVGEIISIVGDVLRQWCKVPVEIFLDIVDELFDDLGGAFESYVKTKKALRSFIRSVPQYFYIDAEDRICMHDGFHIEDFKTACAVACSAVPLKRRSYTLGDLRIIQTVRDSFSVLHPLLDRAKKRQADCQKPGLVVALDCEGCNLGKTGRLTLVQVATMEGQVYLFDVVRCPHLFEDGLLADLLESDAVLKVIHDCRQDSAALYHQFGVTLTNVFDTSIAYLVLQDQCAVAGTKPRPRISFKNLCEMVGEEVTHKTNNIVKKMRYVPNFWARRPLKADMITYAASDVYLLLPNVYQTLDRLVHPKWKGIFLLLCQDTVREQTDDSNSEDDDEDDDECIDEGT